MIPLISWLIKLLATVIFIPIIGMCGIMLSAILWDHRYVDLSDYTLNMMWPKKEGKDE